MIPDYTFESSTTFKRFKRLQSCISVTNWGEFFKSFEDFWYVRDAFSHTFIDLDKITYRDVPLDSCFGYTYTGASHTKPNLVSSKT